MYIGRAACLNQHDLSDTWYASLFKLLTENVRKDALDTIFNNISFLAFNYDRCIEHYIYNSLQTYYRIDSQKSQSISSKLEVFHPYGVVGSLPWQSNRGVDFGSELSGRQILEMTLNIRTFHERTQEGISLDEMRRRLREAHTIIFLGFAFHDLNMKLLDPLMPAHAKRIFATAKGLSRNDCNSIVGDIHTLLQAKEQVIIELRNELTCFKLFDEYWRTMPRS